jgi:hypothetical protein
MPDELPISKTIKQKKREEGEALKKRRRGSARKEETGPPAFLRNDRTRNALNPT